MPELAFSYRVSLALSEQLDTRTGEELVNLMSGPGVDQSSSPPPVLSPPISPPAMEEFLRLSSNLRSVRLVSSETISLNQH